jgi:DNA-binding NtrC family response regulator
MPAMGRVLVVDDDQDLAESLADYIGMSGHEVAVASNGKEAVECFRERDFDMALMDVRMPIMNGVDSFLEIRKLRPDAKVVLMTGFKEPIVETALQNGALGLLHKPFALSDLNTKLTDALAPAAGARTRRTG